MNRGLLRVLVLGVTGLLCAAPSVARDTIGLCIADDARLRLHAEMRTLLRALHGVHQALAKQDFEAVAERAARAGTALAGQVENQAAKQTADHYAGLPREFIKLGRATHAAFDDLAALAREEGRASELLPALSKVSGHCVQCHAKYRLAPAGACGAEEPGPP